MAEGNDREPGLCPIGTDRSPTEFLEAIEQPKRHFLGLYQDAGICIGTNDSGAEMIKTACGQEKVKEKDQLSPIEWNRTINASLGGGRRRYVGRRFDSLPVPTTERTEVNFDL